jgi:hypothetical protein
MKGKAAKQQPKPESSEEPLDSDDVPLDSPYPFSEQGLRIAGPGSEEEGGEGGESGSEGASGSGDIDDDAPGSSDVDVDVADEEEAGSSGDGMDADEEEAGAGSDDGPGILGEDSGSDGEQADVEGGSSSGGEEDDDSGGGSGGEGQAGAVRAGLTEGGKSASLAKAFAKVLAAEGGPAVAILGGSKSLAKRKAEDDAEVAERQAAPLPLPA